MSRITSIGILLKKVYRKYSSDLCLSLQDKGFADLRPSFLEVLIFISTNNGSSIKVIGSACGLKKQTMTSHINELEKRGYIYRNANIEDKREQNIFLTEYGEKFKLVLFESVNDLDENYSGKIGKIQIERIESYLKDFHDKIQDDKTSQLSIEQFL